MGTPRRPPPWALARYGGSAVAGQAEADNPKGRERLPIAALDTLRGADLGAAWLRCAP